MIDVVNYTYKILGNISHDNINIDACIISSYYHDVGRLYQSNSHEQISAIMLMEEMIKLGYNDDLINTCYNVIIYHRWDECSKKGMKLDDIINLLPILRN